MMKWIFNVSIDVLQMDLNPYKSKISTANYEIKH